MLCSALTCQVYVGTWQHTPVAVKILLNTALDVYNEEAVNQALTLSNPVLENLQKVWREQCVCVSAVCELLERGQAGWWASAT
mgnify:CR=1 FL=1